MKDYKQLKFIYGAIFFLANRLQVIGDKMNDTITTKQYFFLVTVSQFPSHQPTISELAEFMGSSRQNVKKSALILEQKEMIHLKQDSNDKRAWRISLTEVGNAYLEQMDDEVHLFLEQLFAAHTDIQLEYMEEGMLRLAATLAKWEEIPHEIELAEYFKN